MPLIEFPSEDGTQMIQADVQESAEGGCQIAACMSRPMVMPDGDLIQQSGPAQAIHDAGASEAAKPTQPDAGFSLQKANKFLRAWALMMKHGAVDEEVYRYRRGICEGVEGVNPPCPHNADNGLGERYCNQCGCGNRRYATLYIEGKPDGETERLWMPDPQCPVLAMRPMPGSGSLKAVGGRLKQMGKLLLAGKDEIMKRKATPSQGDKFLAELEGESNGDNHVA